MKSSEPAASIEPYRYRIVRNIRLYPNLPFGIDENARQRRNFQKTRTNFQNPEISPIKMQESRTMNRRYVNQTIDQNDHKEILHLLHYSGEM